MTDIALVTGATGFVGSALCRALLDSGVPVRALHRPNSSLINLEGLSVAFIEGDILNREAMKVACTDVRWVFHAASQSAYWRDPGSVKQTAVEGTRIVAEAAFGAGVERLVFTSSLIAMGLPAAGELLTEEHSFNLPESHFPYGAAKRQAELALLEYVDQGLDAVIVNPSIILGAGDVNRISGSMVTEAARGWGFFYLDGGSNYIHIDDAAQGHLAAARYGRPGQRYILGGENLSHHEAFSLLTQVVGRRPPWLKLPAWIIPPAAWLVDRLPRWVSLPFDSNQLRMSCHYIYCDTSKARNELKFEPRRTFQQAAEEAFRWYVHNGMLPQTRN